MFLQIIEFNPKDAAIRANYAVFLCNYVKDHKGAVVEIEKARRLHKSNSAIAEIESQLMQKYEAV